MIKINLLPRIVNEKKAVRNTAIFFGILLVAIIVGGITYNAKLHAAVLDMQEQANQAKQYKARVDDINAEAQKIEAETKPINEKLDFINAVLDYNTQYPRLYEEIAKWTYEKVQYISLQPSQDGTSVQMQMRVKTLDDLGRYLLNMYRATDLFTSVTISQLPGYPRSGGLDMSMPSLGGIDYEPDMEGGSSLAGLGAIDIGVQRAPDPTYFEITVNCTLKNPIKAPQFAGAPAAQGTDTGAGGVPTPTMPGPAPGPGPGPAPGGPGPQPPTN